MKILLISLITILCCKCYAQAKFQKIEQIGNLYVIQQGEKVGLATKADKIVLPVEYDKIEVIDEDEKPSSEFILFEKASKYGLFNAKTMQIIVNAKYDKIIEFYEGFAKVVLDEKFGLINKEGKEIVETKYDDLDNEDGMVALGLGEKYGYANQKGEIIIPLIYDHAVPFSDGLAAVKKNDKYAFLDKTGKLVTDFVFYDVKIVTGTTVYRTSISTALLTTENLLKFIDGKATVDIDNFAKGTTIYKKDVLKGKYRVR